MPLHLPRHWNFFNTDWEQLPTFHVKGTQRMLLWPLLTRFVEYAPTVTPPHYVPPNSAIRRALMPAMLLEGRKPKPKILACPLSLFRALEQACGHRFERATATTALVTYIDVSITEQSVFTRREYLVLRAYDGRTWQAVDEPLRVRAHRNRKIV